MTWLVLFFSLLICTLIAGLLFAMPAIVHPTVPLGVSVPHDRIGEPVIRTAVRRYRIAIVGCWVLAVAGTVFLADQAALALAVPVLGLLVLCTVAYLVARSSILRAKRAGRWYEGVPVRLTADVTALASPRPPIGWAIVSVLLLLVTIVIGAVAYSSLPDPVPVHWNAAGEINGYAAKSVWSVFGPVLIGLGLVALLFAASYLGRLTTGRTITSDSLEEAAHRADVQRRLLVSMLGQLGLVITLMICTLTLAGWFAPKSNVLFIVLPAGLIVLIAALLVVFVVRYSRSMARSQVGARAGGSATGGTARSDRAIDAPDDDRYWKGGLIYVNRNDPAVFVPKRFGVGWTVNLGSAGGFILGLVLLLIIVGAITMAIVAPGSQHRAL
ncbi:DUF1648 domain-containing protein [Rathayibacter soli]|uniref:DUF1648 domain-containing protein n=1 Tax=Rathayibacter soli TaxID=3144168 RepID=UPI0027E4FC37|nr:DUF1648 domain-containing protein [Glaciibacter superstes]